MEISNWGLSSHLYCFTLIFKDANIEKLHSDVRSSKILSIFPKILMLTVSTAILIRRIQLLISSTSKGTDALNNEIRIFSITLSAFFFELITQLFAKLANLRCVAFVILSFYTSIDGSLTYYQGRVTDEPVFAYSSYQICGITAFASILLCHSWIGSAVSHCIGQLILLIITFNQYRLSSINKIYFAAISIILMISYFVCFYAVEYIIRCGIFQYYRAQEDTRNWKGMMDKLSQGIMIQQEKKIIYLNSAVKNLLHSSEEERIYENMKNIKSENSTSLFEVLEKANLMQENHVEASCSVYKDLFAKNKRFSIELRKIMFDGKESIIFVLEDLTVSMELEKQKLNKKFERMFFASFTHEIITPINGIIGLLEIMKGESISEPIFKNIRTAKQTCKLLLYLVNDIAGFSQQQQNADSSPRSKTSTSIDWVSIREIVTECKELYIFSFNRKHIKLIEDIAVEVPLMVCIDKVKYRQILIHLLGNALKYTMIGSVTIKITYSTTEKKLLSSIIDTGIGMAESESKNLFKLFGKEHDESELNPQGIGLGLAICSKYAACLEGQIHVKSEQGKGTCFTLEIPLGCEISSTLGNFESFEENKFSDEENESYMRNEVPKMQKSSEKLQMLDVKSKTPQTQKSVTSVVAEIEKPIICQCHKFLVVDDNELNRFAMQGLLRKYDDISDEALNGEQAVEMVVERKNNKCCNKYVLILMDLNMPVMDGMKATEILKEKMSKNEIPFTPIVAVSAARCDTHEQKQKFLNAGFDDFIEKPFTMHKMTYIMNKFHIEMKNKK